MTTTHTNNSTAYKTATNRQTGYTALPWFEALLNAHRVLSQRALAKKLDIAQSTVNGVLRGDYPADTKHIAARVEATLQAFWPAPASDWLGALGRACEEMGRAEVARRLRYSTTTLSLVLAGKYPGDIAKVRGKIEGCLMGVEVYCMVMGGSIPKDSCIEQQSRAPSIANPLRLQFVKTCPSCPNFYGCKEKDSKEKTSIQ